MALTKLHSYLSLSWACRSSAGLYDFLAVRVCSSPALIAVLSKCTHFKRLKYVLRVLKVLKVYKVHRSASILLLFYILAEAIVYEKKKKIAELDLTKQILIYGGYSHKA